MIKLLLFQQEDGLCRCQSNLGGNTMSHSTNSLKQHVLKKIKKFNLGFRILDYNFILVIRETDRKREKKGTHNINICTSSELL